MTLREERLCLTSLLVLSLRSVIALDCLSRRTAVAAIAPEEKALGIVKAELARRRCVQNIGGAATQTLPHMLNATLAQKSVPWYISFVNSL